ncbi:MAG: DUF3800 domain-containing protein, partial [Candidatus Hodarchaeales archaeon]
MYLIYIDESGTPNINRKKDDFHLAALIIHERDYIECKEEVDKIKKKFFPEIPPEDLKLHAKEF